MDRMIAQADDAEAASYALLSRDIGRFLTRPGDAFSSPSIPVAPPGAPIGEPALDWLGTLEPPCSWWWEGARN
jgi:hypothetical protein